MDALLVFSSFFFPLLVSFPLPLPLCTSCCPSYLRTFVRLCVWVALGERAPTLGCVMHVRLGPARGSGTQALRTRRDALDRQGRVEEAEGLGEVAGAAWKLRSEQTRGTRRNMSLTNESFRCGASPAPPSGAHELI